jgi:hypothetical protein
MEKPNSKNLILEEIRNRIIQLLPLGLNRLYMNLDSGSDFFAATLLGYLPDDFDSMLQHSELTGVAKQCKYAVWTEKLRIFMEFRTSKEEGTRQQFFRFVRPLVEGRGSRRDEDVSADSEKSTPGDTLQAELLRNYITAYSGSHVNLRRLPPDVKALLRNDDSEDPADCSRAGKKSTQALFERRDPGELVDQKLLLKTFFDQPKTVQHSVVLEYLKRSSACVDIPVTSQNGRKCSWFRIPSPRIDDDTTSYDNFRRSFPVHSMKKLLAVVGGSVSTGVKFFVKMMCEIEPVVTSDALSENDFPSFKPLTPFECVALMKDAQLSSNQVAKINRNLRPFHGNKSIFPTKTQLGLVKNKHAPMLYFDKYTYVKLLNEKSTKTEKVTVEYTWADLGECLDKHMKSVRDCYSGLKPGFLLGPEGLCLGLVLLGDHGGIEMKFQIGYLTVQSKGQWRHDMIGKFEGKETYDIVKNTVMPHVDCAASRLSKLCVFVVEWETGFDFVFLPKVVVETSLTGSRERCPDTLSCAFIEEVGEMKLVVSWPHGSRAEGPLLPSHQLLMMEEGSEWGDLAPPQYEAGSRVFDRLDIPNLDECSYKILPVEIYNLGDLAYTMMLQGRMDHAPSKCLLGKTNHSQWQKECHCGEAFTMGKLLSQ